MNGRNQAMGSRNTRVLFSMGLFAAIAVGLSGCAESKCEKLEGVLRKTLQDGRACVDTSMEEGIEETLVQLEETCETQYGSLDETVQAQVDDEVDALAECVDESGECEAKDEDEWVTAVQTCFYRAADLEALEPKTACQRAAERFISKYEQCGIAMTAEQRETLEGYECTDEEERQVEAFASCIQSASCDEVRSGTWMQDASCPAS